MQLSIELVDDVAKDLMGYLGGDEKRILEVAIGLLAWVCSEDAEGRVILSADTNGTNVMRVNDFYMKTKTPSKWKEK